MKSEASPGRSPPPEFCEQDEHTMHRSKMKKLRMARANDVLYRLRCLRHGNAGIIEYPSTRVNYTIMGIHRGCEVYPFKDLSFTLLLQMRSAWRAILVM